MGVCHCPVFTARPVWIMWMGTPIPTYTLHQGHLYLPTPCMHLYLPTPCTHLYLCTCASGWTGVSCEIDMDECLSSPCMLWGSCGWLHVCLVCIVNMTFMSARHRLALMGELLCLLLLQTSLFCAGKLSA